MSFFVDGGFAMWPVLVCGGLAVVLAAVQWTRLRPDQADDARIATGIDAVLFWGTFGAVVGLLGTLGGIAQAARAIEMAGGVSAPLAWGGLRVALHPLLLGLGMFVLSLPLWFGLRARRAGLTAGD